MGWTNFYRYANALPVGIGTDGPTIFNCKFHDIVAQIVKISLFIVQSIFCAILRVWNVIHMKINDMPLECAGAMSCKHKKRIIFYL